MDSSTIKGEVKMNKAINIEQSNNNVVRVLSIAEPEIVENNPTGLQYVLIEDYIEPPVLSNSLAKNYPIYNKTLQVFKWVQVQYHGTATEEIFQIENLKAENARLNAELILANENINMLIELQADILGGAI